jgi:Zn-dependent protease with chaperone function
MDGAASIIGPNGSREPVGPNNDVTKPMVKEFTVSADEVKSMLIRSDPKACSATSDASLAETTVIYARLGLQIGSSLLITDGLDEKKLQANLNAFRPHLRELSRNTNWLPQSAERLIGERIYAMNELKPFVPPARQKPLLDNTIRPIYAQLVSFAKADLKSPVEFELRVVRDDKSTVPLAIAGGIILVPSGLLNAMQRVKDPDNVVAFMLAHEFSHVLRRHKTKMVQLSLVDSITQAGEYKQLYNSSASGLSAATDPAKLLRFTDENVKSLMDQTCKSRNWLPSLEQNQEYEADVCGALLLKKLSAARQTPFDAVRGYGAYLANGLATPVPPAQEGRCVVQTSHPDPARRMDNLQAYAPAAAGWGPEAGNAAALPTSETTAVQPKPATPSRKPPAKPATKPKPAAAS